MVGCVHFLALINFYISVQAGVLSRYTPSISGVFHGLNAPKRLSIRLEGCSNDALILKELEDRGLGIYEIDYNNPRKVKALVNAVNDIYNSRHYFASNVHKYQIGTNGNAVILKCVENGVPEANFKLFVFDPDKGTAIDTTGMELVTSSSHRMKDLKYREERSDRLKAMVYSTKNVLLNLDPAFFRSIQKLGIWKNLEYTIWRTADGQLHMHCYCDGPGITRTVDYTLSNILSKEGAKLNIALRDNDFFGSGLQAEIMTQVGLRDWYKMSSNHTMSANMTYNTLKKTMWSDRSGDTMAFTLACNCGMDDVMRFVKPRDVNEADDGSKSSVKGIMLFKAGATRGNVTIGLDTRTMQFSTDTQSQIRKSHRVPISIKHNLVLKYPRKVPLNSSASDNLYLNSKASASTALGHYNIDIGLGMGTSTDKSGFRGNLAEGKRYLMIAGDVTRQWSQKHLWNTIKPGVFLDVLYSINGMNYPHGRHHFAVSAGVIVRVLGIAIAISLSEIPRNMGSGSADLLKSLQESFYVSS